MFGKLKQQRRIATHYDKTILSFESFLNLAAARLYGSSLLPTRPKHRERERERERERCAAQCSAPRAARHASSKNDELLHTPRHARYPRQGRSAL